MLRHRKFRIAICMLCIAALICSCTGSKNSGENAGEKVSVTEAPDNSENSSAKTGGDQEDTGKEPDASSGDDKGAENVQINPDAKVVSIDPGDEHQTFDGFGAAYTWYGERLLDSKDPEGGLDALFSDAKLTVLRFKNEYSYHVAGKASNASAMARNYKEARDRAAKYGERVYVLMCCWSPPAYLKSDNSISTGTGTLKKNDDGSYCYDEYAAWWVDSLKYYMARGIVIDYVSIQNEVDFAPADYEGCLFGPKESDSQASYAKAFLAVYRALKEEFGDDAPKMLGPETMSCVPSALLNYTNDILKEDADALSGVAYHLYVGGTSNGDDNTVKPNSYMTNFNGIKNYFGDIKRWETEFYIGHALQTSELIHYALCYADMTAYLYWSGVWNDSTPNKFESYDLVEVNNAGKWRLSANYYALRHYSQFIRPGYVRLGAVSADGGIKATVFASPYRNKLAVVLVNNSEEEKTVRLEANGYTIDSSKMYLSVFGDECTSEEGLFEDIGSLDNNTGVSIPGKSVLSIDIDGYYGDTPPVLPEITPVVYENDVIIDEPDSEAPSEDMVIMDRHFEDAGDLGGFTGMGSSSGKITAGAGEGGSGCLKISGRSDTWNGIAVSNELFDHYGYLLRVSYDCMLENGGSISCTPTFTCNGATWYPSGENDRVSCEDMEAGKWYHAEGFMTMYSNMEKGSYRFYWEVPDNTDDFYLDNVRIEVLYTVPAGDFDGNEE